MEHDKLVTCPVCGKQVTQSKIPAHVMNSKLEPSHKEFILKQDVRILDVFDAMSAENFTLQNLINAGGMLCSTSYIRSMLNAHRKEEWKIKRNKYRSVDTSQQHKDGRREKIHIFGDRKSVV